MLPKCGIQCGHWGRLAGVAYLLVRLAGRGSPSVIPGGSSGPPPLVLGTSGVFCSEVDVIFTLSACRTTPWVTESNRGDSKEGLIIWMIGRYVDSEAFLQEINAHRLYCHSRRCSL